MVVNGDDNDLVSLGTNIVASSRESRETILNLKPTGLTYLPNSIIQAFRAEAQRLGLRGANFGLSRNMILTIPASEVDTIMTSLPKIVLEMGCENERNVIAFSPKDYLRKLRHSSDSYLVEIAARSNDELIEIGRPLLDKVVLYIDGINRRIGFADPILE